MLYGTDYQRLWATKADWTWAAADGAQSRQAPNGATYWVWGDTIVGYPAASGTGFDAGRIMVSNSIMVQRGAEVGSATFSNGTPAVPDKTMNAVARRFWVTDIIFPTPTPGKAYALCQRIHDSGGLFITDGAMIAEFNMYEDKLDFVQMHETPSTLDALETTEIQWAQTMEERGGYIYVYGYKQAGAGVGYFTPHRTYVARVPSKRLTDKYSWQFWNGTGWAGGRTDTGIDNALSHAQDILDGMVTSVRYDTLNSRWLFASKPWNGIGGNIQIHTSANPQGTLALKQNVSSAGGTSPGGNAYITYNATLHPQVSLLSGKTMVGISHNGDFTAIFTERTLYKPEFQEVTIPL
jgi:hypothetical protein